MLMKSEKQVIIGIIVGAVTFPALTIFVGMAAWPASVTFGLGVVLGMIWAMYWSGRR